MFFDLVSLQRSEMFIAIKDYNALNISPLRGKAENNPCS